MHMHMHSIGQAAERLGVSYHWAHKQVRRHGLGRKVGWGVVLSDSDLEKLECVAKTRSEHGRKAAA